MRFTFNWLKRYLDTDLDINQIANKLTSIGIEVEDVSNPKKMFENFRVVQIEKMEKHPNADSLNICSVLDGDGNCFSIVCGAKNARPGLKTILALPGAYVPSFNSVLKKSKIRGIESEGMMCSFDELLMPSKSDGIIELNQEIELSASVEDVLGFDGGVLDVSITPNRGDCFSVKGIARDLAAAGAGKFISLYPEKASLNPDSKKLFKFPLKINGEKKDICQKYAPIIAFRVIRGIKNSESPEWLKSLFRAIGVNSISSIVDLSNLWMMDSGRPLHIYDLNKIKGDMSIRLAKSDEKFFDINKNEYILKHDMLVSADEDGPLCLLGIMGGEKTACDENTTDILVESGLFDPVFISRTGTFLNLTSDSRTRFERCVDQHSCIPGIESFTDAVLKICGGEASEICVIGEQPNTEKSVTIRKSKLRSISGYDIDWEKAKMALTKLGLTEINSSESKATFQVPSWRADINIEEDLVEEVLRIVGYDDVIEERFDTMVVANDKVLREKNHIIAIKRLLASSGLSEIVSYSFIKQEYAEAFSNYKKLISLLNPISDDLRVMRPSLIPSLLLAVKRSLNFGQSRVELFESGNIFYNDCVQELVIAGVRAGMTGDRSWLEKNRRMVDVFDAKRDLMAILEYFGIEDRDIAVEHNVPSHYHPSRGGTVYLGKRIIGYFGELHPKIGNLFDISEKIVCFEFLANFSYIKAKKTAYTDKVFPKINRDFSFIFNANKSIGDVLNNIYKLDPKVINAEIFDCFEMKGNKKSIGITITLGAADRTMTEEEAKEISDKIIKYVDTVGGEIRKKWE